MSGEKADRYTDTLVEGEGIIPVTHTQTQTHTHIHTLTHTHTHSVYSV